MSYNKLHDPWLTGGLLFFSGCLVCSIFFQDCFRHSSLLLGLSVFGLLTSLVYSTLPEDAESKSAYVTARMARERESKPEDKEGEDGKPTVWKCIYNACVLLVLVSFIMLVVSIVLAMFFGLTDGIFLMEAISAGVFGFTFWVAVAWTIFSSPSGFTPWWWGV